MLHYPTSNKHISRIIVVPGICKTQHKKGERESGGGEEGREGGGEKGKDPSAFGQEWATCNQILHLEKDRENMHSMSAGSFPNPFIIGWLWVM